MVASVRPPVVVLFDLGGVLVRTRTFARLAEIVAESGDGWSGDGDALRARWLGSPSVRAFELGRIPPSVFAQRFTAEWQLSVDPAAFAADLATWIVGPFAGSERLVADLQGRRYHVSCLSNGNEAHWREMTTFLSLLDSTFSSHLLGEIKPDERAFLTVAERLGVAPAQMVFFDDSRPNIAAAERLGTRSFLVDGPDACRAALEAEGLL
jgi:FMN phosphatase YigB (HAD superfamily)